MATMAPELVAKNGWPKKQATSEFSLNRTEKHVDEARLFMEFECKTEISVDIKYFMRDIITSSVTVFEAAMR